MGESGKMKLEEIVKNGWTCNECEFYDAWNGICKRSQSEKDLMDICEEFELCELLKQEERK